MKTNEAKMSLTVREFFQIFPDDETCLQHVFDCRYGQGHVCPKCAKASKWSRMTATRAFACQWCGHHIHPTAGTLFADTRTPMQLWFYAMYLFTTSRHGVSGKELERQLGVTYKTAWRIGHQIRKHMADVDGEEALTGEVECDETYVGGVREGVRGRGAGNKTIVFGMLQRNGKVMTKVVPNCKKVTLQPLIEENVTEGSTLMTDEHHSYKGMDKKGFKHETCDHGHDQYVNGNAHTNGIENFWKHLKCGIRSTHIHVSGKHLGKYAKEFEFRFNSRGNPSAMFPALVSQFPK